MTTDTIGGVWSYSVELAKGLAERSISVTLAAMGGGLDDARRDEIDGVNGVRVLARGYKLEWMDDPWRDVEAGGAWLLSIEAELEPDIIHLNGYAHGALTWSAPVLIVGHSCVCSWFREVKKTEAPPEWDTYRRAVRRGLQNGGRVTAPTEAMLRHLKQFYGPINSVHPIYNGRRPKDYPPGPKDPFILGVGRLWDEGKNLGALDRLAAEVDWEIRLVGNPRNPSNGLVHPFSRAKLLGQLSSRALAQQMRSASILAHPARYEPFGLVPLEAGLSGCALVLGDVSSLREVWGDAALFVPPDDDRAIAAALQYLIVDSGARVEMAKRARKRALEFGAERMTTQYVGLYRMMAAEWART